jgi:hypothetical protein
LNNSRGFERVLADWRKMKDDIYGTKGSRLNDEPRHQMTNSATRKDITTAPIPTRPLNIMRAFASKEKKMKNDQAARDSGRSTTRELIVCLNNFGCKNHAYIHGANAFFDLWPTDRSASNARDLNIGQTCIVAKPESNDDVSFCWFEFSHREDGLYQRKPCWVFYGDLVKPPVRLQKAVAARTEPYTIFFNVNGGFKRHNVLRTWY